MIARFVRPSGVPRDRLPAQPLRSAAGPESDGQSVYTPPPGPATPDPTTAAQSVFEPEASPTPAPTSAPAAEDRVYLSARFGQAWADSLSDAEASSEARWHRLEQDGFPGGAPPAEEYAKHYASAHPGVRAPAMPGAGVRTGRLKPAAVTRMGLTPLGTSPAQGDVARYEPALVSEGEVVVGADGRRWRVVVSEEGWFDVEPAPGDDLPQMTGRPESPPEPPAPPTPSGTGFAGVLLGVTAGFVFGATVGALVGVMSSPQGVDVAKK